MRRKRYVPCVALVSTEFTQISQKGNDVPKVVLACQNCGESFERFPADIRHSIARGTTIKFCSRACTDAARSKGLIGTKKIRGKSLVCEVCDGTFYRKPSMIKNGKSRFCSEPCRIVAYERGMIDRTAPRPNRKRGRSIACVSCGDVVYRKQSLLDRNVAKTCGAASCVSAYGRGLWGLAPRSPETVALPRSRRKQRPTNFSPKQRREWLGAECVRCGTTENLMLDHVVAVCCGGLAIKSNAQTLCGPCNNWKAKHIDRPLARQQLLSGG